VGSDAGMPQSDAGTGDGDAADGGIVLPPARWLAFHGRLRGENGNNLYVVDVTAAPPANPIRLNPLLPYPRSVKSFAWSPNGAHLAYIADQDTADVQELWVVDMTAAVPGPLVKAAAMPPKGNVWNMAWSPDSRRIAFSADAETDDVSELYVVDLTGPSPSAPVKLNNTLYGAQITGYKWAPDSTRIAFRLQPPSGYPGELHLVDVSGPTPTPPVKIATSGAPSNNPPYIDKYEWAPDSKSIAYDFSVVQPCDVGSCVDQEFFWVDVAGSPKLPAKIDDPTPCRGLFEWAYASDASYVAQHCRLYGKNLFLVALNSLGPPAPVQVNAPLATDAYITEWSPAPNGLQLVYEANQGVYTRGALFSVSVLSGKPGQPKKIVPEPAEGPVWSPDSRWIAYWGASDKLYAIDMSSSAAVPILLDTPPVQFGAPHVKQSFSANSAYLATLGQQALNQPVYVVDFTTGAPGRVVQLIDPIPETTPQSFKWRSDSNAIAIYGTLEVKTRWELWYSLSPTTANSAVKAHPSLTGTDSVQEYAWQPWH
jgi:Tol biopolymer transport system component